MMFLLLMLLRRNLWEVKVAMGTGMAGDDSTIPAPVPASPRPRQSPLDYRGRNDPHPREYRVSGPRRGLHGDLDEDAG
jgi:hypothetical protein